MLGWLLHVLFNDAFLKALHALHVAMGAAMAGMAFRVMLTLTRRPLFSCIVAFLIALNPALFLFEAFAMYSLLTAFLVMLFMLFLALYQDHGNMAWLYSATAGAALLVLTRGTFHLVVLIPVILGGCLLAASDWRKYARVALLIALIPTAWYAKNAAVFGFFGASSWAGSNLWRIASTTYSEMELRGLHLAGVIDEAAAKRDVFDAPSQFEKFGFTRESSIPTLSNDDYHNINMLDISRMHGSNAVRLIRHDPLRYLDNVRRAYLIFCKLSYETRPLQTNRGRMIPAHLAINEWLHGVLLMRMITRGEIARSSSLYVVAIPLCLLLFCWKGLRAAGLSGSKWLEFIRTNPVYCGALLMIAVVVLASVFFEYGENCRFKFAVIIPTQICLFSLIIETCTRSGRTGTVARP